jgi:putative hydrolases of HD superfamily
MTDRLERQLRFLVEIDRVKHIFRQTRLFDRSRHENDAEHAWHLALMALVLGEHAESGIDLGQVVRMVLIHDLVEIDAGDVVVYARDDSGERTAAERAAAERIFGLLPADQRDDFFSLWVEFECRETPEARFAAALDRLEPILQNHFDQGYAWKRHDVSAERGLAVNRHIEEGSETLWAFARSLIEQSIAAGHLRPENSSSAISDPPDAADPSPGKKEWFLYLVRCRDGSLYTGITTDLERRLAEHRDPAGKGAKYFRGRLPITLEFSGPVGTRSRATRLENRVQRLSRLDKERLLAGTLTLDSLLPK